MLYLKCQNIWGCDLFNNTKLVVAFRFYKTKIKENRKVIEY